MPFVGRCNGRSGSKPEGSAHHVLPVTVFGESRAVLWSETTQHSIGFFEKRGMRQFETKEVMQPELTSNLPVVCRASPGVIGDEPEQVRATIVGKHRVKGVRVLSHFIGVCRNGDDVDYGSGFWD